MDCKDNFKEIMFSFTFQDIAQSNVHVPSSMPVSGIHRAVLEEDLNGVKQLIDSGESVNEEENHHYFCPLHLAAIKNDLEILTYLLAQDGVDVNARCLKGKTPLYYAAALDWTESVAKLAQAGADPSLSDHEGNSPLHISVDNLDICHLLIRQGSQIDAANNEGCTPLHEAVRRSSLELVCMLLYYNADANVADHYGLTPFMTAINCNAIEIQSVLLDYVDDFDRTNRNDLNFASTLSLALLINSPFARDIIERGADVNYGDLPEVSHEGCAFLACLLMPVDVSTFKMVWERLRYNDDKNTINLITLLSYADAVPRFLPVILESDNFQPVVEFFSKANHYYFFVNKFAKSKFDLNQLTVLTCRLLQEGVRITTFDVHTVFLRYGYCELFKILLYMNNNFAEGWLPGMSLCRLVCDVNYDLKDAVRDLCYSPKKDLFRWFEYSIDPLLIKALSGIYSNDEDMSRILASLPRVPSLVELSRNAIRKYVRHAVMARTSCQFYTVLNSLPLPSVCKSMLMFERKIYVRKW